MRFWNFLAGLRGSTEYEFSVQSKTNINDNSLPVVYFLKKFDSTIEEGLQNGSELERNTLQPPERLEVDLLNPTSINLTWYDSGNCVSYVVCFAEVNIMKYHDSCEQGESFKR